MKQIVLNDGIVKISVESYMTEANKATPVVLKLRNNVQVYTLVYEKANTWGWYALGTGMPLALPDISIQTCGYLNRKNAIQVMLETGTLLNIYTFDSIKEFGEWFIKNS